MDDRGLSIVLLSGGMDSTVCVAQSLRDGFSVAALHVNYGQRTMARELQAFEDVCNHYGVEQRLVVDISHLASIGGSSLTDVTMDVPTSTDSSIGKGAVPSTYVPFRNANILAIATSWAEVIGATAIYIGAVEEDSSGYPDCSEVFFQAFQATLDAGTRPETSIQIYTPLIRATKNEIVHLGVDLDAPLHLSWSCYTSSEKACGRCDSCVLRLRGFAQAGHIDPVIYGN